MPLPFVYLTLKAKKKKKEGGLLGVGWWLVSQGSDGHVFCWGHCPLECASALDKIARETGVDLKIAVVPGEDIVGGS